MDGQMDGGIKGQVDDGMVEGMGGGTDEWVGFRGNQSGTYCNNPRDKWWRPATCKEIMIGRKAWFGELLGVVVWGPLF